jgi:hypothetical protein
MYGIQWPEPSRANRRDVITLRQGGADAPRITLYRKDGVNGDSGFAPLYPFKMRGSVSDLARWSGAANLSNKTYAIDVPIVTNATFDLLFRVDGSANNILAKLDGGMDLNSHMGFGPTNGFDRRDNRPGSGERSIPRFRTGAISVAHRPGNLPRMTTNRNNLVSDGAETYHYVVGPRATRSSMPTATITR